MNTQALIEITVQPDNSLQLVNLPKVPIETHCQSITASTSLEANGTSFSIFVQPEPATFIVCKTYDVETETYFKQEATIAVDYPIAQLHSFYFGGQPWLLSYHPDSEYVQFYRFDDNPIAITPVTGIRVGKGFTTVQPLYYRNDVFFVAYNKNTGDVVKMQIVAPAHSALYAQKMWSATWAQGWTRFAFFRLGAENFFIKTNEKYHKVNIDHFMDSIELGSHPVLNEPASEEMLSLSNIQTFYDISQYPYFFTYNPNGAMTFNRFDGDCEGWQLALSSQQSADASLIHTVQLKECTLILML